MMPPPTTAEPARTAAPVSRVMASATNAPDRPTEIRFRKADKTLDVTFGDGTTYSYPAELLRVESPSAEVQGHGPGQKRIVAGRRHVSILEIEPVGHYAIRLVFDDLHDTGIYSWSYLRELGAHKEARWNAYLAALRANGLSRDP